MLRKRISALLLALVLALSLAACCGAEPQQAAADGKTPSPIRIAALKGPTAMGLVRLMNSGNEQYSFTLAGSSDEVTPKLMKGELDIACIPANLAAVLYQKTNGGIVTLGINTLGVLYIVENGDTIHSVADLAGKTVVGSGKGSTPEYALRYLLRENGIDPDSDVTLDWKNEHSECLAALLTGQAAVALLPQPFVSAALDKLDSLRIALDLTAEWDALDTSSSLITGVIAARRDFVAGNGEAINAFLGDYGESVDWVNANTAEAAELIGAEGIMDAAAAEKALPYCHIVCIAGENFHRMLEDYLTVLYEASPVSVGGALPESEFYWNNTY